jgi:hypothetical protein
MSISQECDILKSLLSDIKDLTEEAQADASDLSSCALYETGKKISQILSLCYLSKKCFQDSQNQVEVVQALFGQTVGFTQSNNSNQKKGLEKDLIDSEFM